MKMSLPLFLFSAFFSLAAIAADTFLEKVGQTRADFLQARTDALARAATLEDGFAIHDKVCTGVVMARSNLHAMVTSLAWKDLANRSTVVNQRAFSSVLAYLRNANAWLDSSQDLLDQLDEAAFQAWAKVHPEEAKMILLERRVRNVEEAAKAATANAQKAEGEANKARREARAAASNAEEANIRANEAIQNANDIARKAEFDRERDAIDTARKAELSRDRDAIHEAEQNRKLGIH
jgi:hypothetical protein